MGVSHESMRISDTDWPTAPGQGAISIHCRKEDVDNFASLRSVLNHPSTEQDVNNERKILQEIGGGCLYPAGIKISEGNVAAQISPKNWREIFCQGLKFDSERFVGKLDEHKPRLPASDISSPSVATSTGPKLISTLNSDRLARILQNRAINVMNQPVIELVARPEMWPQDFLDDKVSRSEWPYLV